MNHLKKFFGIRILCSFYNRKLAGIYKTVNVINLPRLCIKENENFIYRLHSTNLFSASILTWLGFNNNDDKAETELIMTIKRAILLTEKGDYTKAESMLHIALRLAQEQRNANGILYIYDLLANVALENNDLEKAETLFTTVLRRILGPGGKETDLKVIHISLKLARIYHKKKEYEKAELGFKWCLGQIAKCDNNDKDVFALSGVIRDWYAQFLFEIRQFSEAMIYLQEAYAICCKIEGPISEKAVLLLNDMGTASWQLQNISNAKKYYEDALRLGRSIENFDQLGVIYANLGLIMMAIGSFEEARKYCKKGWLLGTRTNNSISRDQATYCLDQLNRVINL